MTVHLTKHRLIYVSVPKIACSSLKRFFFEIENGFSFRVFKMNGRRYGIHGFAPSVPLSEVPEGKMTGHVKIAAIHDPWSRILSCYASKVVGAKVLHGLEFTPQQKKLGLVTDPSIDNFIDLLPHYREVSWNIRHHSEYLSYFLGTEPALFDRLFALSNLSEMVNYVATVVGKVPDLPHVNKKTAAKVTLSTEEATRNCRKIEAAYSEDLEIFGTHM